MVTKKAALKALAVLEAFGKQQYCETAGENHGSCIGIAVARLVTDVPTVVSTCIAALEDWNGHLSVACIDAIENRHGEVTRKGRKVSITLPEHWAKL